jgi:hypothetical protein
MPTTYQELKDAVLAFANNQVIEQSIDTFIDLNEADMSRRIRHWRMEKRAIGSVTTQYIPLPSDFYEPIRVSITSGDTYTLELIDHGEIAKRRMQILNTTGRPRYFTFTDGQIEMFPSPDGTYTVELLYYAQIDALSSTNTSNWVLNYFPDAYVYGTLLHSAPFMGEDARLKTWSALYDKAVNDINFDNENAKTGSVPLRMKVRSY